MGCRRSIQQQGGIWRRQLSRQYPQAANFASDDARDQCDKYADRTQTKFPLVPGFDLGVIGDLIMHKGKSYLTFGSLVSALQVDGTARSS